MYKMAVHPFKGFCSELLTPARQYVLQRLFKGIGIGIVVRVKCKTLLLAVTKTRVYTCI